MKHHRWMAVVPYELTGQDALRMAGLATFAGADLPPGQLAGDEVPAPDDLRPFLGLHNVRRDLTAICCFDCEVALTDVEVVGFPCVPATDESRYGDGAVGLNDQTALGAVGRNDPCPCGSGLKFKRCHGDRR